jgi:hypothetical protein
MVLLGSSMGLAATGRPIRQEGVVESVRIGNGDRLG